VNRCKFSWELLQDRNRQAGSCCSSGCQPPAAKSLINQPVRPRAVRLRLSLTAGGPGRLTRACRKALPLLLFLLAAASAGCAEELLDQPHAHLPQEVPFTVERRELRARVGLGPLRERRGMALAQLERGAATGSVAAWDGRGMAAGALWPRGGDAPHRRTAMARSAARRSHPPAAGRTRWKGRRHTVASQLLMASTSPLPCSRKSFFVAIDASA